MLRTLNQRATLLARTLTPDGGGGFTESWDAFASVWIALHPLSARDAPGADRMESRVRHRIALRRRGDLSPGQRVAVGARLFRVHAMLDAGARESYVTLLCEEVT